MPIPVRSRARRLTAVATASVAALVVAACATPSDREAAAGHTVDPAAAGSLRGATVFVACEATDPAIRDVCRDQLAEEIIARGGRPVKAGSPDAGASSTFERVVTDARASGARAVLLMAPTPIAVEEPRPSVSFGIGGFNFGRGSGVGGGVGVSAPIGAPRVATGFVASGRVIDVASGRTVWTARADVPPSQDLPSQFGSLAISLMDVAARDGLF